MSVKSTLFRSIVRQNKYINFCPIAVRSSHRQRSDEKHYDGDMKYKKYGKVTTIALFSSVLIGSGITESLDNTAKIKSKEKASKQKKEEIVPCEPGVKRADLPTYRAEEVSQHDSRSSFWVTYKHGVYDVTKFLVSHPGGDQIMNAAGLSIEPFWNVYGMHKTPEVYKLLETYRIGNLHDEDVVEHTEEELWAKEPVRDERLIVKTKRPFNAEIPPRYQVQYFDTPKFKEPARDERLIVKTKRPFNAEIPPRYQVQHFDTPNSLFYVRQHMPVPELDATSHSLTVVLVHGSDKDSNTVQQFKLNDLKKFKTVDLRAALMCAGNRRSEMDKVKPVKGISWQTGAISNAVWSGVLLRDVLLHMGVDETDTKGKHVIFQGADIDATGVNFSTSIPLHMALRPSSKILLATHMNGAPLPPDHGAPLRVVVPGAPAVRSVKWLEKITISEDESPSHWHQKDYRSFNPSKSWETADFPRAPPVYSLPVTSAICDPLDGGTVTVNNGHVDVKGYAYSGGGAKILRVDISCDQGESWVEATAVAVDDAPPDEHYAWTLWEVRIPVSEEQQQVEIWAKATDSNFNTQPERFNDIWNIRGILSNAYHRVTVNLQHKERRWW